MAGAVALDLGERHHLALGVAGNGHLGELVEGADDHAAEAQRAAAGGDHGAVHRGQAGDELGLFVEPFLQVVDGGLVAEVDVVPPGDHPVRVVDVAKRGGGQADGADEQLLLPLHRLVLLETVLEQDGGIVRGQLGRIDAREDDEGAAVTVHAGDAEHPLEQLELQVFDELLLDAGHRVEDAGPEQLVLIDRRLAAGREQPVHPVGMEGVGRGFEQPAAAQVDDDAQPPADGEHARAGDVDHEGRGQPVGLLVAAAFLLQPADAGIDHPPDLEPPFRVGFDGDERALEIHRRRQAAQFVLVEGAGGVEQQAEKALGRSLVGREDRGRGEDDAQGDGAVFLAHHAHLVAGGDEMLQGPLARQDADGGLALLLRRRTPALADQGDEFGGIDVHGHSWRRVFSGKPAALYRSWAPEGTPMCAGPQRSARSAAPGKMIVLGRCLR